MTKKIAVFPGSFSPFTKGHQSIVNRALPLFDEIIISVGINSSKNDYFSIQEKVQWIENVFAKEDKVKVNDKQTDQEAEKDSLAAEDKTE